MTPAVASQRSTVQALPSSMLGAVPGRHVPAPSHSSLPLHTFASAQDPCAATNTCVNPVLGSQSSVVQGFPSSGGPRGDARQAPRPLQNSIPLQGLPSEQEVPSGTST